MENHGVKASIDVAVPPARDRGEAVGTVPGRTRGSDRTAIAFTVC